MSKWIATLRNSTLLQIFLSLVASDALIQKKMVMETSQKVIKYPPNAIALKYR